MSVRKSISTGYLAGALGIGKYEQEIPLLIGIHRIICQIPAGKGSNLCGRIAMVERRRQAVGPNDLSLWVEKHTPCVIFAKVLHGIFWKRPACFGLGQRLGKIANSVFQRAEIRVHGFCGISHQCREIDRNQQEKHAHCGQRIAQDNLK